MRSWNVARNALVGVVCQILMLLFVFGVRTVFIHTLPGDYLGLTSLFSSIIAVLDLSELGLSAAITFALYRPLAESDEKKIVSLLFFYRNAYRMIGGTVLLLGLLLVPFLPRLIHGEIKLINIYFVYSMYLVQTVVSYWFWAYKRVLLTASQNEYLISISTWFSKMAASILQIIVLVVYCDAPKTAFYIFVGIGIASNVGINYITATIVDCRFPYIRQHNPTGISADERDVILKNVVGSAIYKICNVVSASVSNILISVYVNLASVGLYANYILLRRGVTTLLSALYRPFTASIGNLNVLESREKKEFIFRCLHLMTFWISGIFGVGMWVLFNPFIGGLWLDETWLMSSAEVFAIVLKYWVDVCMGPVIWFREAAGLFWKARYRYILTFVVNLCASLYLLAVLDMGILGVLLGSLISDIVRIIIDPFIVFGEVFQKRPWEFYRTYFCSILLAVGTAMVVQRICNLWDTYTIVGFLFAALMCFVVPNLLWWIMFHRTKEYHYLEGITKTIVQEKLIMRLSRKGVPYENHID